MRVRTSQSRVAATERLFAAMPQNFFAAHAIARYTAVMVAKPQFSLRTLLLVTAAIALISAEAVAFPGWLVRLAGFGVTSVLLVALLVGLNYTSGYRKAFSVGATMAGFASRFVTDVFPSQSIVIAFKDFDPVAFHWRIAFCMAWIEMLAGGLAGVAVRWFFLSRTNDQPPPSGEGLLRDKDDSDEESPHSKS